MIDAKELRTQLEERVKACGLSADVYSSGSLTSEIIVIAEAPGETEKQLGMPLVGGSGKYTWESLRKIGIQRAQCYVTNVVKRQLVIAKDERKIKLPKSELDHWKSILRFELDQLPNPKYILCLGNYALEAVTEFKGIKKYRGSVFEVEGIFKGYRGKSWIVCTYNPANVYHDPKVELHFKFDIGKLDRCHRGTFRPHNITAHLNPTLPQAIDFLRSLDAAQLPVASDIEVIGNQTACIGFANSNHEGMCINFRGLERSHFTVEEEFKVRKVIAQFYRKNAHLLVMQNGGFDTFWLGYHDRIIVPKVWFDTLLAHHTLYPAFPHNLGFLTTQYTNHPFYKDEKDEWRHVGDINKFWEYNVKDCCLTRAAQGPLLEELRATGLEKFFFDHVMRLQPHLVRMSLAGVRADIKMKDKIAEELAVELEQLRRKFYDRVKSATGDRDYEPNFLSNPQMRDLYFNRLGLVGRGTSIDKENRDKFLANPRTPDEAKEVINAHNILSKENKFYSTYATMAVHPDGQIRCDYKQYGVQSAPGRLSSASTLDGYGTNLQNQPDRAKKFFIAEPGYRFVYFDLSQAEARVVALAWGVKALQENFERAKIEKGFDVHRANASRIFMLPLDQIPTKDFDEDHNYTMRYLGKRCVHGLNYRMMAPRLAETCNIPLGQAIRAHRLYHFAFPEVSKAWNLITQKVQKEKVLYNPFGRRWILLQRYSDEALESIVAFYPQSTIGDKVSQVIYQCHDDPEWPNETAIICLNVHDALIAKCKLEDTERVGRIMRKHAQSPIPIIDLWSEQHMLEIPCELAYSQPGEDGIHRWSTLEKVK